MGDYGEFEEIKEINPNNKAPIEDPSAQGVPRVRMPRKGEFIGVILQRYGGNRMEVLSTDGKRRNCRVPGRFKRELWLRPKDIVMIVPWIDDDEKGDIVYKYNSGSVYQLRKKGMLDSLKNDF